MRLFILAVQLALTDKQGKVVLIDSGTFIVEIVPDKAALLPGLRKGIICQQFPVFILRVQVKYKYPSGVQIIIDQPEQEAPGT